MVRQKKTHTHKRIWNLVLSQSPFLLLSVVCVLLINVFISCRTAIFSSVSMLFFRSSKRWHQKEESFSISSLQKLHEKMQMKYTQLYLAIRRLCETKKYLTTSALVPRSTLLNLLPPPPLWCTLHMIRFVCVSFSGSSSSFFNSYSPESVLVAI